MDIPVTEYPTNPDAGTLRNLLCACCGGEAGAWEQFWNQDTGYGLCASCARWIEGRESRQYVDRCYGVAGVHRPAAEFRIGDKVTYTNEYGCAYPGKTITGSEVWDGYTETRYFCAPSDSPWFSVPGSRLTLEARD